MTNDKMTTTGNKMATDTMTVNNKATESAAAMTNAKNITDRAARVRAFLESANEALMEYKQVQRRVE